MKQLAVIFCALALMCGPAAALAQATPSPAASPASEDPAITTQAKAFYAGIIAGKIDRSHLSPALNAALTDRLLATLSQQLGALGTPAWTFLRTVSTPYGPDSEYRLTYPSGTNVYYQFGVTASGTIGLAAFTNQDPGNT